MAGDESKTLVSGVDVGSHDLETRRAILMPTGALRLKSVTPDFYPQLIEEYPDFTGHSLIQKADFTEPWGVWEMHPGGDADPTELASLRDDGGENAQRVGTRRVSGHHEE